MFRSISCACDFFDQLCLIFDQLCISFNQLCLIFRRSVVLDIFDKLNVHFQSLALWVISISFFACYSVYCMFYI